PGAQALGLQVDGPAVGLLRLVVFPEALIEAPEIDFVAEAAGIQPYGSLEGLETRRVLPEPLVGAPQVRPGQVEVRSAPQDILQLLLRLCMLPLGDEATGPGVPTLGKGRIQLQGALDGALRLFPRGRLLDALESHPVRLSQVGPGKRTGRVRLERAMKHLDRVVDAALCLAFLPQVVQTPF